LLTDLTRLRGSQIR